MKPITLEKKGKLGSLNGTVRLERIQKEEIEKTCFEPLRLVRVVRNEWADAAGTHERCWAIFTSYIPEDLVGAIGGSGEERMSFKISLSRIEYEQLPHTAQELAFFNFSFEYHPAPAA
jgi:hypothetical protein